MPPVGRTRRTLVTVCARLDETKRRGVCIRFTARGPGDMRLDDHFRPEDRGGLYHAVHDVGHKHTVRETGEKTAAAVLVLEPAVVQRLDVHRDRVLGRVLVLVHVGQVKRERHRDNNNTGERGKMRP